MRASVVELVLLVRSGGFEGGRVVVGSIFGAWKQVGSLFGVGS